MYENKTYANLLQVAMDDIGTGVQKNEGSLVYNALSALAFELNKIYIQMDYIITQSHADTADIENLTEIAADRAVYRKQATEAVVEIQTNIAVPIGTRFSLKGYVYTVTEELDPEEFRYAADCGEPGAGPNGLTGAVNPIDYVEGLESAVITSVLVDGADAESRDALYQRYLESFQSSSFAGNVTAYKETINAIDGVGGCKIYRVWNGPGTVKAVIISAEHHAVTEYLLNKIRESANPTQSGSGYGWAPIDHTVTFESVEEVGVDVETTIAFSDGYSIETSGEAIREAIGGYLDSLSKTWASGSDEDFIHVYISRLESAVLDVPGVIDISGTTINGEAHNIDLATSQIPAVGEVTLHVQGE